jgi:transcriptional regulator with XRE-family HTH domain
VSISSVFFSEIFLTTFGDEVKRLRTEKGLSQKALAETVGVTQGFISHIEVGLVAGVRSVPFFFRLCDALGVSTEHFREIVTGMPEEEPIPAKPKRKKMSS